jgi:hypothetical protein
VPLERKVEYIIVRFFDADTPVEAVPYFDKDEAVRCWELAQLNWTECFLCKVIDGHSEYAELSKRLTTQAKAAEALPDGEICPVCNGVGGSCYGGPAEDWEYCDKCNGTGRLPLA